MSLSCRGREKERIKRFSFVHYETKCKYHLYIFKKYKIDIDFFKQILFVLSFIQIFIQFFFGPDCLFKMSLKTQRRDFTLLLSGRSLALPAG